MPAQDVDWDADVETAMDPLFDLTYLAGLLRKAKMMSHQRFDDATALVEVEIETQPLFRIG